MRFLLISSLVFLFLNCSTTGYKDSSLTENQLKAIQLNDSALALYSPTKLLPTKEIVAILDSGIALDSTNLILHTNKMLMLSVSEFGKNEVNNHIQLMLRRFPEYYPNHILAGMYLEFHGNNPFLAKDHFKKAISLMKDQLADTYDPNSICLMCSEISQMYLMLEEPKRRDFWKEKAFECDFIDKEIASMLSKNKEDYLQRFAPKFQ